jgi:hypothetical protein
MFILWSTLPIIRQPARIKSKTNRNSRKNTSSCSKCCHCTLFRYTFYKKAEVLMIECCVKCFLVNRRVMVLLKKVFLKFPLNLNTSRNLFYIHIARTTIVYTNTSGLSWNDQKKLETKDTFFQGFYQMGASYVTVDSNESQRACSWLQQVHGKL